MNLEQTIQQLPKDWKRVQLGEVCKLKNGFAFKSSDYKKEGIPVIRISDIKSGSVRPENSVKVTDKKEYNDFVVLENEILVAMSGATTGKFGVFKSKEKAYQNQRVGKFQILNKEALDSDFLLYQLHALKRQIEKDAYGGAQPNISSGKIEAMEILLPPISTQRAIVSKIEELFSELDKGIENLRLAQQQLKTYRQAVLKWAFEGRLTNENVKEGELPQGWTVSKFEDIEDEEFRMSYGVLKPGDNVPGGIPLIQSQHIKSNLISNEIRFNISKELDNQYKRTKIKGDEILITLVGASIGRCAITTKREIGYNVSRAVAVLTVKKSFNLKFILYFLNNFLSESRIKEISTGSAQPVLNLGTIRNLEIYFPSSQEQQFVVSAIEERLSVSEKLEEIIIQNLQHTEALRQSILKNALQGGLI